MSARRPDPVLDAAAVHSATAQLIDAVSVLPEDALRQPSPLPGWTRGHVLAHLCRNADGLLNLLTWARTGVETPAYASAEARDKDIGEGAGRPLAAHLEDLRAGADRFARAAAETPPQAWAAQVQMRSGAVIAAAELPYRRLVEILLHHVDLDIGFTCQDLPEDFAARELEVVLDTLTGHEGIAPVRLHDTDSGKVTDIGAAEQPEITVTGPRHALLAWVTGRSDGTDLTSRPDRPLPALPPL